MTETNGFLSDTQGDFLSVRVLHLLYSNISIAIFYLENSTFGRFFFVGLLHMQALWRIIQEF